MYGARDLAWQNDALCFGNREIARIIPDQNMWRVKLPNGQLSDITNRTRARDAARTLALATHARSSLGSPQKAIKPAKAN
jgi:hypothetical protein